MARALARVVASPLAELWQLESGYFYLELAKPISRCFGRAIANSL